MNLPIIRNNRHALVLATVAGLVAIANLSHAADGGAAGSTAPNTITPQEQAEGLRDGLADGYIVRPFSKVDFLARIGTLRRLVEAVAVRAPQVAPAYREVLAELGVNIEAPVTVVISAPVAPVTVKPKTN